jgi:hypothetical protein
MTAGEKHVQMSTTSARTVSLLEPPTSHPTSYRFLGSLMVYHSAAGGVVMSNVAARADHYFQPSCKQLAGLVRPKLEIVFSLIRRLTDYAKRPFSSV